MQVYVDGRWVDREEAKVSVFDHGFLYGDGVFEGLRAYGGRVFRLDQHLKRLETSARAILLDLPLTREGFRQVVLEACRRNGIRDGYIRLVVSRGAGDLGLDPRKCPRPTVVCIADQIALYPRELVERGLHVMTVSTRRLAVDALSPQIKSLNYLNNILAKIEANRLGVPEVIMLNAQGYVVEATGDNIFIVKDGIVYTPPAYVGILEGITRGAVLDLCKLENIPAEEKVLTVYDLYAAEECFLTGTAAEVVPVTAVDERPVGDGKVGPVTRRLMAAFHELTQREGALIEQEV